MFPASTDASGALSFELTACNESGSVQTLATPLELAFRLSSSLGTPLCESDSGLLLRGGGSIGVTGVGRIELTVRAAAGARGGGARELRVEVAPVGTAAVVPARVPRAELASRKWVPSEAVSVATVCTPAFRVEGGGGGGGGGGRAEAAQCTAASAALHVLPLGVRILERHTFVTSGFGSICWDAALIASRVLAAVLASPSPPRAAARRAAAAPPPAAPLKGLTAVELGCGTGFLGISAAALGASVTLTDGLPDVLPLARENVALNRAAVARAGGALAVQRLAWGDPPPPAAPFDLVLASECVYSQEQFAPFAATLRALVGPGTRVLLAVRPRACCLLDDLMALLCVGFEAAEVRLGAEEAALVRQCGAMSKTEFAPQLFVLTLKQGVFI